MYVVTTKHTSHRMISIHGLKAQRCQRVAWIHDQEVVVEVELVEQEVIEGAVGQRVQPVVVQVESVAHRRRHKHLTFHRRQSVVV